MADIEGFGIDPLGSTPGELLRSIEDLAPGPLVMSALLMIDRSASIRDLSCAPPFHRGKGWGVPVPGLRP